jgi:hypothetical protein
MLNKLIIFLLCRKLGVKIGQPFRFVNQKSKTDYYMFEHGWLLKYISADNIFCKSNIKLNWLLDDECEIEVVKEEE